MLDAVVDWPGFNFDLLSLQNSSMKHGHWLLAALVTAHYNKGLKGVVKGENTDFLSKLT